MKIKKDGVVRRILILTLGRLKDRVKAAFTKKGKIHCDLNHVVNRYQVWVRHMIYYKMRMAALTYAERRTMVIVALRIMISIGIQNTNFCTIRPRFVCTGNN